jgi:hypothetical protein
MIILDELGPAFKETGRKLFRPFSFLRFLGLSFLVLAMGGWWLSVPLPSGSIDRGVDPQVLAMLTGAIRSFLESFPNFLDNLRPWVLLLALVWGALWMAYVFINSIFKFVFFDAIALPAFSFWGSLRSRFFSGVSLFLFVGILHLFLLAVSFRWVTIPFMESLRSGADLFEFTVPHRLLLATLAMAVGVLELLATDFLVPLMAEGREGLTGSALRLGNMVLARPGEFFVYIILRCAVQVAGFIVACTVILPCVLVLGAATGIFVVGALGVAKILELSTVLCGVLAGALAAPLDGAVLLACFVMAITPTCILIRLWANRIVEKCGQNSPMSHPTPLKLRRTSVQSPMSQALSIKSKVVSPKPKPVSPKIKKSPKAQIQEQARVVVPVTKARKPAGKAKKKPIQNPNLWNSLSR